MRVTFDSPLKGQAHIKEVKEQILKDITTYLNVPNRVIDDDFVDDLCQIAIDNFKELEKEN